MDFDNPPFRQACSICVLGRRHHSFCSSLWRLDVNDDGSNGPFLDSYTATKIPPSSAEFLAVARWRSRTGVCFGRPHSGSEPFGGLNVLVETRWIGLIVRT